jgi:hypothetical protein
MSLRACAGNCSQNMLVGLSVGPTGLSKGQVKGKRIMVGRRALRRPACTSAFDGYVAAAEKLDARAGLLYAILFLWQLPHFMAIAWTYREDYAKAGYEVLPQGEGKGR